VREAVAWRSGMLTIGAISSDMLDAAAARATDADGAINREARR